MTENTTNDLNNPNDKFFKGALSMYDIARPLLEQTLPKDLLDKLDLDTLEIDPNSYITDELKEFFSDLVWTCRFKNGFEQRKIALLFEHKSYKPLFPHFQLLDYQRNAWKLQVSEGSKPVPMLPIVFYHGKDKWVNEPFDSYFGKVEPEMLRYMPCFDYILINMQDYSDEQIKQINAILLQKTLLAFKHYLDKNYLQMHVVELLFAGFKGTDKEINRSFIRKFVVYLAAVSGMTRKEIIEKAQQSDNNLKKEDMEMDIFDEIAEICREKGMEKGMEKEKIRSVLNLFKKGLAVEIIADYLEYPINEVKQIIANYKPQQSN
jgi:predicted transposase/invertase (TIGR01784 family)